MDLPQLEMAVDELINLDTKSLPSQDDLLDIYMWIDSLELSRPKKCMARDFSDGVMMAEVIHKYCPQLVDLKNYYSALSKSNKANNWQHLSGKVFGKLGFKVEKTLLNEVMESKPGAIEKVMFDLRPILARRNRSILNYRIGEKPKACYSTVRKPQIPNAMTHAFECKRKLKSNPQEKLMKYGTFVVVKAEEEEAILDAYSTPKSSLSRESSKRIIEQDAEQNEGIYCVAESQGDKAWSHPTPSNASHERMALFGEELLLTGQVQGFLKNENQMGKFIAGIPGVTLGFYGLV